jgi:hypothetical protein
LAYCPLRSVVCHYTCPVICVMPLIICVTRLSKKKCNITYMSISDSLIRSLNMLYHLKWFDYKIKSTYFHPLQSFSCGMPYFCNLH